MMIWPAWFCRFDVFIQICDEYLWAFKALWLAKNETIAREITEIEPLESSIFIFFSFLRGFGYILSDEFWQILLRNSMSLLY